jgi:2-phosphosulfolactate phosphatase
MTSSFTDQQPWDIRCEWGAHGIAQLAPTSDAVIIVDVLSFATCVDVAVSHGATVYPYHLRDESAAAFAASHGALLANSRDTSHGFSLSPASLRGIPAGLRLVLPSPNGATLSLATGTTPTFAGCLRNARAVAQAAQHIGRRVGVIPAGERWPDGSLRPAIEDLIGAGAIIAHLEGTRSPEAAVAYRTFVAARDELARVLTTCSSGRELCGRGFAEDVMLAGELDISACAPVLKEGAYVCAC